MSAHTRGLVLNAVPLWRLYSLRAGYLLLAVGLGIEIWPGLIGHRLDWGLMQGVVQCVLAAISILAILGLRYPVQMLPLLFFELTWKALWLGLVALPLYRQGRLDNAAAATAFACLLGVVFLFLIPWRHVVARYMTAPGDRWV